MLVVVKHVNIYFVLWSLIKGTYDTGPVRRRVVSGVFFPVTVTVNLNNTMTLTKINERNETIKEKNFVYFFVYFFVYLSFICMIYYQK